MMKTSLSLLERPYLWFLEIGFEIAPNWRHDMYVVMGSVSCNGIKKWDLSKNGTTCVTKTTTLELLTDSVFSVGIRSVFLGNYRTDSEGKLGLRCERQKKSIVHTVLSADRF